MGFRRSSREDPGSSRWRTRHRSALIACGVPDSVLESDRTLTYVLLHGVDEFGTGWAPTWLTDTQAIALHELLLEAIQSPTGYDIFPALDRRLRRRNTATDERPPRRILFYAVADDHGELVASTGAELVEHTDADAFWGDGGDGSGENMLGRILMEVRSLLAVRK